MTGTPQKGSAAGSLSWKAFVGVAAILVVVGIALRGPSGGTRPPRLASPERERIVQTPQGANVVARRGSGAAEAMGSLPGGAATAPHAEDDAEVVPLALDEFMGILESRVPKAVAEEAAKAFMGEPALKNAWNRFTKARGKKAPASEFVDFITRVPQFKSFVANHGSNPAVQAVFEKLLKDARFEDAVRAEPGVGTATRPVDIAREWERKAVSGVNTGDSTMLMGSASAAGIVDLAARRGAVWSGTAMSGGASASGGSSIGGSGADAGAGRGGGTQQALKASGSEAHNVSSKMDNAFKTKTVGNADTTDAQKYRDETRKWITKFLAALKPDSARKAIQNELESGREDQWGACFITGNFQLCRSVCDQVPEAKCENKTPYWACRSANTRQPLDCIKRCLNGNPMSCEPDYGEWIPFCSAGTQLAQNECRNSMEWGPCRPIAGGGCDQEYGFLGGAVASKKVGVPAAAAAAATKPPVTAPVKPTGPVIAKLPPKTTGTKPPTGTGPVAAPIDPTAGQTGATGEPLYCPVPTGPTPTPDPTPEKGWGEKAGNWLDDHLPTETAFTNAGKGVDNAWKGFKNFIGL